MLIQFESARKTYGGNVRSSAPRLAPGAWRNLLAACRAAFIDICAVLAAFLLVTATGLGLAFALFVAFFVKV